VAPDRCVVTFPHCIAGLETLPPPLAYHSHRRGRIKPAVRRAFQPHARMFQQLLTISRNTFLESIRQPIYVVLLFVGFFGFVFGLALAGGTMEDDNVMMVTMGTSWILVVCLGMSAFTAAKVLTAEIENRTVLTVVSKPVSRPLFVLGKFTGVAAAIAVAFWVLSMFFLLTIRHRVMQTAGDVFDWPVILFGFGSLALAAIGAALGNYYYRWIFTSAFVWSLAGLATLAFVLVLFINKSWGFQSVWTEFRRDHGRLLQVMVVLALEFEAVLVLTAVAIAASTRLGQVMTLVICVVVFLASLLSDWLFGSDVHQLGWQDVHGVGASLMWLLANACYSLTPNLSHLYLADAVTQGHPIPTGYVALATIYSLLFICAILALAVALFQTREVG
jgi:ABC-type transport system involved in multi-copper enzyme maturation permease subunit